MVEKEVQQFFFFLYYICNYLYKASSCIIIFHLKIFLHNEGDKLDTLVDISRHFAFQVPNSFSPCNFLCGTCKIMVFYLILISLTLFQGVFLDTYPLSYATGLTSPRPQLQMAIIVISPAVGSLTNQELRIDHPLL